MRDLQQLNILGPRVDEQVTNTHTQTSSMMNYLFTTALSLWMTSGADVIYWLRAQENFIILSH